MLISNIGKSFKNSIAQVRAYSVCFLFSFSVDYVFTITKNMTLFLFYFMFSRFYEGNDKNNIILFLPFILQKIKNGKQNKNNVEFL